MNDLTLYRHSIFTHQTGEVAVSEPATPTVELVTIACPVTTQEDA